MERSKIINLIKMLIIIATAVAVLVVLSRILVLKSEDGINQFDALYKQPENSIDVLFVGSSKVYCDIATGVLWEKYGIASFDLGGAEAPAWVSYYQLKEGINRITDLINGKVKNLETRLKALKDLAKDYKSFAGINEKDSGSVTFITTIDSLKKENFENK